VANAFYLVNAVVGTVTSLVTAYIALDNWRRERRYQRTLPNNVRERVGSSSDPGLLIDVEPTGEQALRAEAERRRRQRRRQGWLWGLVGVAAAVAVGSFLGWRASYASEGRTAEISATQPWTDIRVDCRAGHVLDITATGTVYHNRTMSEGVGPDGDPDSSLHKFNVAGLHDANHAGLIGSIEGYRPYFFVGKEKAYVCPADGGLFLGINDTGLDNNRGKFVATIKERTIAS
jgi:hypothetical protein